VADAWLKTATYPQIYCRTILREVSLQFHGFTPPPQSCSAEMKSRMETFWCRLIQICLEKWPLKLTEWFRQQILEEVVALIPAFSAERSDILFETWRSIWLHLDFIQSFFIRRSLARLQQQWLSHSYGKDDDNDSMGKPEIRPSLRPNALTDRHQRLQT